MRGSFFLCSAIRRDCSAGAGEVTAKLVSSRSDGVPVDAAAIRKVVRARFPGPGDWRRRGRALAGEMAQQSVQPREEVDQPASAMRVHEIREIRWLAFRARFDVIGDE